MERLYPSLAQDMRTSDFVRNYDKAIGVTMRFGATGALNMMCDSYQRFSFARTPQHFHIESFDQNTTSSFTLSHILRMKPAS